MMEQGQGAIYLAITRFRGGIKLPRYDEYEAPYELRSGRRGDEDGLCKLTHHVPVKPMIGPLASPD